MKKIRAHIKRITIVLTILISCQSCSVYYSEAATMEEAMSSAHKVKVKTADHDIYKFNKIVKEEDQIYGLAKKNSFTAKDLNKQIIWKNSDQKEVTILLTDEQLNQLYLKNKSASTLVSVGVSVVALGVLIGIGYSAVDSSIGSISFSD